MSNAWMLAQIVTAAVMLVYGGDQLARMWREDK